MVSVVLLSVPLLTCAQQQTTTWESGTLEKKQKVGVWEYYSYAANGQRIVTHKYDHTARKLLYCRPDGKEYMAQVDTSGQWTRTMLDQPPWCVGGHEALAAFMSQIKYPPQAQQRGVQGRVVVSFVIDTLGQVSDHRVAQSIGSGCDEEALRVCRSVQATWVPGRIGTRAVPVMYELPFTFRLK